MRVMYDYVHIYSVTRFYLNIYFEIKIHLNYIPINLIEFIMNY